jgi:uncharacterized protein YqgC (DUF456 family)
MAIVLWVLAALLVAVGIVGTVLPALPGPILVLAGLIVAAWADGFSRVGVFVLLVLAGMTAFAHVIDLYTTAKGAEHFGASRRAAIGAAVGLFFGGLLLQLPGLLIGPFLGAVIGEYTVQRKLMPAGRAGFGAWLGLITGIALKLGLVFGMVAVFLAAYFWW